MKIKKNIQQILTAYNSIDELASIKIPIKSAFELFKLKHSLEPYCLAEIESEKKLATDHGGVIENDGTVKFNDLDSKNSFQNGLIELYKNEIEIEYEPIAIKLTGLNANITMRAIESLDGFISFEA